jgi:serine/threonine protein kinase
MLGTPAYMAPESATSALSDLYGLGCVIYEMLSGKQPFDGDSQQEIIRKHLTERPALTQIPPGARRIVGELLEKDPTKRPQSATQLLLELETGKTAKVEAAGGSGPNKMLLIGIAAAVVVIAAIAGGIFLLNSGDDGSAKTASSTSADPTATNTSAPRSSATAAASPTSAASGTTPAATSAATSTRAAATPVTAVDTAADQQFVGAICTAGKKFTTDLARITSDPNLSASPSLAATRMAIPFGDFADAFGRAKPPKDLEAWHATASKQLNDVVAKLKKGDFSVFDAGAPFDDPPPAAADRLDRIALKNQDCIDADFTFSS